MNKVGQIFVVLIFVMSLVFMTFSIMVYTTHKNWREEILRTSAEVKGNQTVGWKERYNKIKQENADLINERSDLERQLNAEKLAKSQALAKQEVMYTRMKAEFDENARQLAAKEKALLENTSLLSQTQASHSNLTTEVQKLRKDIATSQTVTDTEIKRAIELDDKLAKSSGELAVLKERNEQLAMDVDRAKRLLASHGASIQDPDDASKISVAGKIRSVGRNQVELSIGTDDGVRNGQELDIYRGNKYVGRVRVIKTEADKAVAANLTEYQQYPIQRDDNVASRLRNH